MCLTEFNEEVFVDSIREEGREEGKLSVVIQLVKKGRLSVDEALEELQISKEEFEQALAYRE